MLYIQYISDVTCFTFFFVIFETSQAIMNHFETGQAIINHFETSQAIMNHFETSPILVLCSAVSQ